MVSARKREPATELNTLTQAAVARMLGVSRTRVGQLVAEGRLQTYRVAGWATPRILRSDAERFMRERARADSKKPRRG